MRAFRDRMKSYGFPVGKKDTIVAPPPLGKFSEIDYMRGLIDGDGSLGITQTNCVFLSFVTNSIAIKEYYVNLITRITHKPHFFTKTADGTYRVNLNMEEAQYMVKTLYYDDCLSLNRKLEKAKTIINWTRTINPSRWTAEEIKYALNNSLEQSATLLNRIKKAISVKVYDMKRFPKYGSNSQYINSETVPIPKIKLRLRDPMVTNSLHI